MWPVTEFKGGWQSSTLSLSLLWEESRECVFTVIWLFKPVSSLKHFLAQIEEVIILESLFPMGS